jgi:hypothetical protein
MANYGIPYMGSKGSIAHKVAAVLPKKADNFYDLFGGGFSMTHYMLLHRRDSYKHFHFNEYTAPKDIKTVMAIRKLARLSSNKSASVEKVFANESGVKWSELRKNS